MDAILYLLVSTLVRFLQALPLNWVARIGRAGGAVAYTLDARHRRVAQSNLAQSLGSELSATQINQVLREHFRRLGENYSCAIKTSAMSWAELEPHVQFVGVEKAVYPDPASKPHGLVVAIGHFGNFELYARFGDFMPSYQCGTTYRGLRQPSLNRLLQSLRERSGCTYFERRSESAALKAWMAVPDRILGLLADQHAGTGGIRVPFFGRECSTTTSPAVFALRYNCALHTGICYRVGLAQWRIELGPLIPTRENGKPRSVDALTREINHAFEEAVRRDPANWFWVHNRWKPDKSRPIPYRGPAAPGPASTRS